ncbi:MAG: class I SAM-dependent methyltransferase [Gemmatimonadetes bacterium]|nr:class I SAM-dependent methyltransferase [Gemmatimonadota bacterium]
MGLEHVRDVYEKLGREDPMYAVLTRHELRGNRWDPAEFFRRGAEEITDVMAYIAAGGWPLRRGWALDFGAGVGRLTQALGDEFEAVVGVDISSTMVEAAERYNRHGDRVRYLVNTQSDLALLPSESFDFIYSSITLQHVPPEPAAAYVGEFMRVLQPGGLAIFQTRNGPRIVPGTLRARLYVLRREHFRRVWQRLRGRAPYEMHYLNRGVIEEIVAKRGGRMLDVVDMNPKRPGRSLRYCATR